MTTETCCPLTERLAQLTPSAWAGIAVVVAAGTVLMFFGWKLYRVGLVLAGALGGAAAALWAVNHFELTISPNLAGWLGAAAGGLAAWPLERFAIFLIGGSAGILFCLAAALKVAQTDPAAGGVLMGVAGIGFAVFGWLALKLRKPSVILSTSAWGAMALVLVPSALMGEASPLTVDDMSPQVRFRAALDTIQHSNPMMISWLVLSAIGIAAQYRLARVAPTDAK